MHYSSGSLVNNLESMGNMWEDEVKSEAVLTLLPWTSFLFLVCEKRDRTVLYFVEVYFLCSLQQSSSLAEVITLAFPFSG